MLRYLEESSLVCFVVIAVMSISYAVLVSAGCLIHVVYRSHRGMQREQSNERMTTLDSRILFMQPCLTGPILRTYQDQEPKRTPRDNKEKTFYCFCLLARSPKYSDTAVSAQTTSLLLRCLGHQQLCHSPPSTESSIQYSETVLPLNSQILSILCRTE